jgi:hypothetical protein
MSEDRLSPAERFLLGKEMSPEEERALSDQCWRDEIARMRGIIAARGTQTIQRTSKRIKKQQAVGCLVFAAAGAALGVALSDSAGSIKDEAGVAAGMLLALGLLIWAHARASQWWHHG